MNLRPRETQEPEINLTSLIDVVFLLLIFFMISTTFERQAALKIDLPEASATEERVEVPERLEFVIDKDGRMYINDQQLVDSDPATVRAALERLAGEDRSLPIMIRADAQTPHHYVVTAMDVSGQLGFNRLSIATERAADSD